MTYDISKRASALTLACVLLAAAPAAHAGRSERAPATRPRAHSATSSWLATAWHWLTSVWDEEGSEINPNGTPAPKPPTP